MFSIIRKRFTWPNVALTLALVFVMTGGAYAAKKVLITSTKQISPKVLKQLQGKTGPAGAPGAQGLAGPVGPAGPEGKGAKGDKGDSGTPGAKGEPGAAGAKGATGPAGATGPEGEAGLDGKDGKDGATGPEGSPWTNGGTLPSKSTETGTFAASGVAQPIPGNLGSYLPEPIAFTIKLSSAPATDNIHLIGIEEGEGETHPNAAVTSKECSGTVSAPGAASGNLCLFLRFAINLDLNLKEVEPGVFKEPQLGLGHTFAFTPCDFSEGACTTGTVLMFRPESTKEAEALFAAGTWAVTAE